MAHFAELDENNVVTRVIVIHNNELAKKLATTTEDGYINVSVIESEQKGVEFCKSLYGENTRWVQTSYNNSFRGKYAGIGDTYENGVFVAPVVEVVEAPVVEAPQAPVVETLTSTDVAAITSTDIPALTTSDISSLG